LLGPIEGRVLEIGAGTGASLPHYGRLAEQLLLAEPDPHMRRKLTRRLQETPRRGIEILEAPAETLPLDDDSVDAVVSMLVLCSVRAPELALSELFRVLRPGGKLVVMEHVASRRPDRLRWQQRIEPVWKRLAGNCHLTRPTAELIARAGFVACELERESMRKALPFVRPTIRGTAEKPARAA
jgi:ubiquinone/menaquinone biosynthesis C-methylase UbiE